MATSATGIRAGRAYVELGADGSKLNAALRKAEADLKAFGTKTSEIGKNLLKGSAFSAVPVAIATKTFAAFDDQMRIVQAVTGSTGKQFERLTDQAKELGRTTSFTAAQVAAGMTELGRAGFNASEIEASISGVMDLARATATEVPLATGIASGALRAFGMDASEMGRVCDVLTVAANGSAQTLEDMGEALKYVAPLASQAGMSIEDTSKVIGALANFSIKGSQAGTTFKNILTKMADPAIQEKFRALGISTVDAAGNLRNVSQVMRELGQATRDMPNAKRLALFAELFDMRAMAGGAALSGAEFVEFFDKIDDAAGKAKNTAQQMDAGIGGTFRVLMSAIEGSAIALGQSLSPSLTELADKIRSVTTSLTEWLNQNQQTVNDIMNTVRVVATLGAELLVAGKAIQGLAGAAKMFQVIAASSFGPWGALLAAVTAVATVVGGRFVAANVKATASAKDAVEAVKAQAEAHRASEAEHQAALGRLKELSAQQILTDTEMEEAAKLVKMLSDNYGDLGISLDQTSRKLTVAADAQSKLNEAQRKAQMADIDLVDQKLRNENDQIEAELKSLGGGQGVWREMGARLGLNKNIETRMNELYARQGEILNERRNLKEKRKILEDMGQNEEKEAEADTETLEKSTNEPETKPVETENPQPPKEPGTTPIEPKEQGNPSEPTNEPVPVEVKDKDSGKKKIPYVGETENKPFPGTGNGKQPAFTNEMRDAADAFEKQLEKSAEIDLSGDLESQKATITDAFENYLKVQNIKLDAGAITKEQYDANTQKARDWTKAAFDEIDTQQETNDATKERQDERQERQNTRANAVADAQNAILTAQQNLLTAYQTGNGIEAAQAALDKATENFNNEKAKAAQERAKDAQERLADAQTALTEAQKTGNQTRIDQAQAELAAAQAEVTSANADLSAAIDNAMEANKTTIEMSMASSGTFDAFEALDMGQDWQREEMRRQSYALDRIKVAVEKTANKEDEDGDLI